MYVLPVVGVPYFYCRLRINEDYGIYSLVKIATAYYTDDCVCSLIRSNISDILMPRKCCAYTCRASNECEKINTEDSGKKLSVYRLPADTEERRKWT